MSDKTNGRARIFLGAILGILLGVGGMLAAHRFWGRGLPEAEFSIRNGRGAPYQEYLHVQQAPEELLREIQEIWMPVITRINEQPNTLTNVVDCTVYRSEDGKTWGTELPSFRIFRTDAGATDEVVLQIKKNKKRDWETMIQVAPPASTEAKFLLPLCERFRDEVLKAWTAMDPNP